MGSVDPIPDVRVPDPVSRHAGIGEASRNVLIRFVIDVFNRIKDSLSSMIRHAIENTLESVESSGLQMAGGLIDRVLAEPNMPPDIRHILTSARSGEHQVGAAVVVGALIAIATSLFPAAVSGFVGQMRNASFRLFTPGLLDVQSAIRAYQLDPANYSLMFHSLTSQGLTGEQIDVLQKVYRSRLALSDLMTLWLRGDVSDTEFGDRLARSGVDLAEIQDIKKLGKQIPGPSDLVRFGLREVWRDDVAAAYGYDEGQSSEMSEWMQKQGYGPEWARAFWRAHWEIPSAGQMIEMFHRQQIDHGQLVQGLKVNDIAPGWIDPLLGITYNLMTRVDVKRALRYGEYSIEQVYDEYRQLGYDEQRARILTNIAIKESIDEAAGLTRTAIVAAYKKRRMSRQEALESLEDIGILGDVGAFYLDQADYDRSDELMDRRIDNVEKRYKSGLLTDNQALEELGALGVGGEEARVHVETWTVARKTTVKRPTRANLDEFVRQGIVDPDTYRIELESMGYDDQYIGWYAGSLAFEAARRAAQEEERAQKERARIVADRKSTSYAKGKAELDQDIAELNAAIADAQVALVAAQNERDQRLTQALSAREIAELDREYLPLFREVDAAIAEARLAIQTLRVTSTELGNQVNDHRRSLAAGRDIVQDTKLRNERAALATQAALYNQQIAQRVTDIARLTEAIPLAESAEQQADMKQTILELRTEVAEFRESQADDQIRVKEIDGLLPVELTATRRAEIEADIRSLQAQSDEIRLQIEDLEEGVRQTQTERLAIEREYKTAVEAVPGRAEQIAIKADYDARIDVIQARIATLRSDVAKRRLAKTDLVVGWRSGNE